MKNEIKNPLSLVTIIFLLFLVSLTIGQIVFRSLLSLPFIGAEELARYLLICIVFLGIPVTSKYGEHVKMTEIFDKFPKDLQKLVRFLTHVLAFVLFCVLFWSSLNMVRQTYRNTTINLRIPYTVFMAPTVIGFFLMMIEYGKKVWSLGIFKTAADEPVQKPVSTGRSAGKGSV